MRFHAALALATSLAAFSSFSPTLAQTSPAQPVFVDLARSTSAERTANAERLVRKAVDQGRIRVIVGLGTALKPRESLGRAEAAAQARILRTAQDGLATRVLGRALASSDAVVRFDTIPFVSMFVDAAQARRLLADREATSIQEDVPVPPSLLESVPRLNADDVWAAGFPGTGFTVAILDTGVDKTHPMLSGKVVSEACYSTEDPELRIRSLCPGRVLESTEPGSGVHCNVIQCDHGTHVAGIAAGRAMPGSGHTGVARDANVIAIQVFSRFNRARDCYVGPPCVATFFTDIIKGLERIDELRTTHKIAAVNLSLGGGYLYNQACDTVQPAMTALVKSLRAARIATVIATGNGGWDTGITPPACISAAIAVGSTLDTEDTVSDFSNHAAQVRLMAPGSDIVSSVPGGATAAKNGTSMATPHVVGAFALLRDVRGGATVDDISAALECTGVPVTRANIVKPRIDVDAARLFLLDPPNTRAAFNFNRKADGAAWTPLMGEFVVREGMYRAKVTPGWKISSIPNCNERLNVSVRMRHVEVPAIPGEPLSPTNAGIFIKSQLHPTAKTFTGYFVGYNQFNGGQVFMNRLHNYNLNALNGGWAHVLCLKEGYAHNVNDFNTLRVISRGGVHRVIFNGVEVCNVTDQTFGVGRVAVATYLPDPARGNSFDVDWVTIEPKEGPAAADVVPAVSASPISAVPVKVVSGSHAGIR